MLWVSEEERELQARLMVCAHMQDVRHRGVRATTHRLGTYNVWDNMEKNLAKFVRQCLHCTESKAGNAMPRPLGDLVHGTEVADVLHFDYHLSLGESDAIDMGGLVDGGYKHVLVLMDDVSRFVWLEEAVSCSMEVAARSVLKWCASFGVPKAFTSDGGTHFTGQVMQMVSSRLGVVHHFRVADVSWSHGAVERMNREVVKTFSAVLSERRRPPSEWPLALGAVQWALNSAYRERMGTTPFQMTTGRPLATAMSVLAGEDGDAWTVEELDVSFEQMQSLFAGWVREQKYQVYKLSKKVHATGLYWTPYNQSLRGVYSSTSTVYNLSKRVHAMGLYCTLYGQSLRSIYSSISINSTHVLLQVPYRMYNSTLDTMHAAYCSSSNITTAPSTTGTKLCNHDVQ